MKPKRVDWKKLVLAVSLPLLAGFISSSFTGSSVSTWYSTLQKPWFNPPNWVFGPVWTLLYFLMGVSLYLLWTANPKKAKFATYAFYLQLALNLAWSYLFFGLQNPELAFIEIVILWFAIAMNIYYSHEVDVRAAYLLIPYILWVSFAAVLNYSIFILN